MTNQRYLRVFQLARSAKQSLDARGFVQRNRLPKVTLEEHREILQSTPGMARFTRSFEYDDREYVEDVNRPTQARPPVVREIWVGSRSIGCIGCIGGESSETESEGLSASQLDQEDAAELTDLQTLLYQDAPGFDEWLKREVTRRLKASGRKATNPIMRRVMERVILREVPHDKDTGAPLKVMIEDEDTGEYRPIRNGDCIGIVRGSNDDLDALFLEEGDDPRTQNDPSAGSSDHKWSDRFRANTDLEFTFLTDRTHRMPNSALDDVRWQPDELTMRRLAQNLAAKMIERRPEWADNILQLTDEAEQRLKAMAQDLRFSDDGALVAGYFITRDEFFATIEENQLALEREHARKVTYKRQFAGDERPRTFTRSKEPPAPVDWDLIRGSRSLT